MTVDKNLLRKALNLQKLMRNPAAVQALIAENEAMAKTADCWDRLNVQNKALSDSFRAERDQAEQDYKDVVGTIELRDIEIAKLRAEIAGLRAGYEAYERANAELKAENDALRKLAPSKEIIWCACGDGYPVTSHGAGFMDANDGVCANCDAAMGKAVQP